MGMVAQKTEMKRLMIVILAFAAGCAQETIAHQQVERNANRILVLLGQAGITAEKLKDEDSRDLRFNVIVPKAESQSALGILERHNLPESPLEGTSAMFKEGGMIPTNTQERAKREVGVSGDIINGLRRIDRVVEVSALVSIPEENPLRDVNEAKPKPKASVIITYLPDNDNAPPVTVANVQSFIQAALPELKSAEVFVQMIPVASAGGNAASAGAAVSVINGCENQKVIGIDVCAHHRNKLINAMFAVITMAALLAGLVILSVLKAMRYRKDLTRLTRQVAQIRK
jgi:type III secretion protein J